MNETQNTILSDACGRCASAAGSNEEEVLRKSIRSTSKRTGARTRAGTTARTRVRTSARRRAASRKIGARTKLDPVSLEILWSRLISVSEEQAAMVIRTAFSSIVRESYDYTCVLLTPAGD